MTDHKWTTDELRAWLDRKPDTVGKVWRIRWYAPGPADEAEYLGTHSARTGPDGVGAVQKCNCTQCERKP